MRKPAVIIFLVLSLMAAAIGLSTAAQEATPATELAAPDTPGVAIEVIGEYIESDTRGMTLYSITLDPNTEVDLREHHGSVTWYVDSGEIEFTVASGSVWVCTDACMEGPESEANFTLVPVGESVTLEEGDWAIQHSVSVHWYRSGDEGAVIHASTNFDVSEAAPEDTPTAGPSGGPSPAAGPSPRRCWNAC